jgi:hypothetical protein
VKFLGNIWQSMGLRVFRDADPARKAPVFLRLAKHGDRWLIDRIESRIEEPFTRRLTRVLSERD